MKKISTALLAMTMPYAALAFDAPPAVEPQATGDLTIDNFIDWIVVIIGWLLMLAAVLAVGFIILGGVLYIVSAGNEKRAETAKKMIWYAIVGLAIVFLSLVIYYFVTGTLGSFFTT